MDWKHFLNLGKGDVLGLDVGISSVKMVGLRKDEQGYLVTTAALADVVASEMDNHSIGANSVRAIRKCLHATGARTRLVVCSLNGPEVAVRDFEFTSIPLDEIESAVQLEASQVCPFNTEDSAIDYQIIPNCNEKTKGILVGATNSLIRNRLQLVKEAQLDCALIDVDGLALLNCFNALEKSAPNQTAAILNIGSAYSILAIMRENDRPFVRDMTYAGNAMINHIASEQHLSAEAVERTLRHHSTDKLRNALEEACKKLVDDVITTSRYYKTQYKTTELQKIYVCGGFALVDGFVELLNKHLPMEAVLWNPFEHIRCDLRAGRKGAAVKNILQQTGPAMAVAAGLALRSI